MTSLLSWNFVYSVLSTIIVCCRCSITFEWVCQWMIGCQLKLDLSGSLNLQFTAQKHGAGNLWLSHINRRAQEGEIYKVLIPSYPYPIRFLVHWNVVMQIYLVCENYFSIFLGIFIVQVTFLSAANPCTLSHHFGLLKVFAWMYVGRNRIHVWHTYEYVYVSLITVCTNEAHLLQYYLWMHFIFTHLELHIDLLLFMCVSHL